MYIDTHGHVNFNAYKDDGDEVVRRAFDGGIAIIAPSSQIDTSRREVEYAERFDDPRLWAAVGLHPIHLERTRVDEAEVGDQLKFETRYEEFDRAKYEELLKSKKVVAIGEIGLDYYRNLSPPEAQIDAFHRQLDLAQRLSLPVVIHSREADSETYDVIASYEERALPDWPKDRPLGVMHCFAGDLMLALRYIQIGFMISIPGTCTYPKADRVGAVAGGIPLRWMAVETDAPYLPPQPHRGRRNEPAYLLDTVARIAELRGDSVETVAERTAIATAWLFGLGDITGADLLPQSEEVK